MITLVRLIFFTIAHHQALILTALTFMTDAIELGFLKYTNINFLKLNIIYICIFHYFNI